MFHSVSDGNVLYYGDNLDILRDYIDGGSVDLVYLDPPFNSNRNYNVLFKDESGEYSESQITAFEDTWHWNEVTERTYVDLVTDAPERVSSMVGALRQFIGTNQMMAYLVMMTPRLLELHRVLKPTGSIWLHCDPTASHYLRVLMDSIYGVRNFRNEVVWERSSTRSSISKRFRRAHDVLLFYSKTDLYTFNMQYKPLSEASLDLYEREDEHGKYQGVPLLVSGRRNGATGTVWHGIDPNRRGKDGMHWITKPSNLDEYERQGLVVWPEKVDGVPRLKYYLEGNLGVPLNDVWYDIDLISSSARESLGYPTQKPEALLERIVGASSNPGDVVLDPFCGCGTTIAAAQRLNRRWVGIDVTHLSIALMKYRLTAMFPDARFEVRGEPEDIGAARQLALEDRYQFQWWALSLIKAKPLGGDAGGKTGKKGTDKGIDGVINVLDDRSGRTKRILVQVKSGKVSSPHIRDLIGTVRTEKAIMGLFITLDPPTRDMTTAAATDGFYSSPGWGKDYPRIQILTIEELLHGKQPNIPPSHVTFQRPGVAREDVAQLSLVAEDAPAYEADDNGTP